MSGSSGNTNAGGGVRVGHARAEARTHAGRLTRRETRQQDRGGQEARPPFGHSHRTRHAKEGTNRGVTPLWRET